MSTFSFSKPTVHLLPSPLILNFINLCVSSNFWQKRLFSNKPTYFIWQETCEVLIGFHCRHIIKHAPECLYLSLLSVIDAFRGSRRISSIRIRQSYTTWGNAQGGRKEITNRKESFRNWSAVLVIYCTVTNYHKFNSLKHHIVVISVPTG